MINLLLGAPGGGKSYEAVVYHILPALQGGRKVVTNLPLQVDEISALDPTYRALLDIRTESVGQVPDGDLPARAFSRVEDYGDKWRHPDTGAGPLYVIDECHIPLPLIGTPKDVEHWYSLHRHESADVLLITQSYGKINKAIRDLVQIVYRVRKNVAFGSQNSYTRKVQDGLRGDVVNTAIRTYKPQYFKFYKSHTRGGGAELGAKDIKPFWLRWPVLAFGAMVLFVIGYTAMADLGNPMAPKKPVQATSVSPDQKKSLDGPIQPVSLPVQPTPQRAEPFDGFGLHLVGDITWGNNPRTIYVMVTKSGALVTVLHMSDLQQVGYEWHEYGPCAGVLTWHGRDRTLVCDPPNPSLPSAAQSAVPVPVL